MDADVEVDVVVVGLGSGGQLAARKLLHAPGSTGTGTIGTGAAAS